MTLLYPQSLITWKETIVRLSFSHNAKKYLNNVYILTLARISFFHQGFDAFFASWNYFHGWNSFLQLSKQFDFSLKIIFLAWNPYQNKPFLDQTIEATLGLHKFFELCASSRWFNPSKMALGSNMTGYIKIHFKKRAVQMMWRILSQLYYQLRSLILCVWWSVLTSECWT